jgi:hypothetical protein
MRRRNHPKLVYHLAEAQNLPSILEHGLMSTERLLDLTDFEHDHKALFMRMHRPRALQLPTGVSIRDQRPMPPSELAGTLDGGMTPGDWYALLNRFVFFWPNREQVNQHLRASGGRGKVILTFDAKALFGHFSEQAFVAPINTGNAYSKTARRGPNTLVPYTRWLAEGWPDRRSSHPAVEILINETVPIRAPFLVESAA